MPNWCYTKFAFSSDDIQELHRLYDNLQRISDIPCPEKNDFDNSWLGNIAIYHNIDWKKTQCRGYILNIGVFNTNNSSFEIETHTAFLPLSGFWDTVLEQYKNISYVYLAEEPGTELYINTDITGLIYPEHFKFFFWYEDIKAAQKVFPNLNATTGVTLYFKDSKELVNYINNISGKCFSDFDEILKFVENLDFDYIGVYKFDSTPINIDFSIDYKG